jgi:hypothetical protein
MDDEARPVDLRGRKLMVGIPAYDGRVNIKTAFALAKLAAVVDKLGVQLMLTHVSGCSLITKARNSIVHDFLKSDATDLLFIDSDVIVSEGVILRLLALSDGKDVTAGVYPRRGADRKFFLDMYFDESGRFEFDGNGLVRVLRIGTGFMLIRRHVLEHMVRRHPEWRYHNNVTDEYECAVFNFAIKDGEYFGEDYLFCDRIGAEGFTVFLDPTISLPHVGTEEFTRDFEADVLRPMLKQIRETNLKVANG